jgi:hypothetical protein
MSDTTERNRFRFSLKAILLIMAILALLMGTYVKGYRDGYTTATDESQADYVIWKSPTK